MSEPNKIRKWVVDKFDGISPGLLYGQQSRQQKAEGWGTTLQIRHMKWAATHQWSSEQ